MGQEGTRKNAELAQPGLAAGWLECAARHSGASHPSAEAEAVGTCLVAAGSLAAAEDTDHLAEAAAAVAEAGRRDLAVHHAAEEAVHTRRRVECSVEGSGRATRYVQVRRLESAR